MKVMKLMKVRLKSFEHRRSPVFVLGGYAEAREFREENIRRVEEAAEGVTDAVIDLFQAFTSFMLFMAISSMRHCASLARRSLGEGGYANQSSL